MNSLQDPTKWIEQGRWFQPPFASTFFSYWHLTKMVKDIVPKLSFSTVFAVDGYSFKLKKDQEAIYEYLKDGYAKNTLGTVTQTLDKQGKEIFRLLESELVKDEVEIEKNVEAIIELYKEFSGFWSIEAYMGDLLALLAKDVGYVTSEADLFAKVHPYLRVSWLEREADVVTDMAKEVVTGKEVSNEKIEQYLNEYRWVLINKWIGEAITKEHVEKRIAEEVINLKQGNHIEKKRSTEDESKLDGLIQLSLSTAYWRAECGRLENMTALALRPIFEKIATQNSITYKEVLLLLPSEFIAVLKNSSLLIENKEKVLERQKEYFSFLNEKGEEVILTPGDAEYGEIKDRFVHKVDHATRPDTLKGVGASPGFAKGIARVIENPDQFKDFKEGEILVSAETTPSFVPLMRLAAAIVTGRGGITSHAAIVSRELHKPCVIAVKDVTKIVKTGDILEVDAKLGIIKIQN